MGGEDGSQFPCVTFTSAKLMGNMEKVDLVTGGNIPAMVDGKHNFSIGGQQLIAMTSVHKRWDQIKGKVVNSALPLLYAVAKSETIEMTKKMREDALSIFYIVTGRKTRIGLIITDPSPALKAGALAELGDDVPTLTEPPRQLKGGKWRSPSIPTHHTL